jgi:hypothetical protein
VLLAVISATAEPEPYILLFVTFFVPSMMVQFLLYQEKDDEVDIGVGLGMGVGVGVRSSWRKYKSWLGFA